MEETEIGVEEVTPAEQSEWGLDDTPDNAPDAPQTAAEEEKFRLKHLGEEFKVTREEMTALAQKGRDYDRIRERLHSLETMGGAQPAVMREVHDFISEYGSTVDPRNIPAEVWREVRAGSPLLTAYQRYENNRLRDEIRNEVNRARSFGVKGTSGAGTGFGAIESDWYN
ncbi:MAG: hypothetical protein LBN00_11215 [Oscillospiraceae bacterium]|jgi:hypothetical protein|nr:hypothetical protein [Oscillospiraceae bacterium]